MNIAILLAGGKGSRLGQDVPKQFLEISGRMMIMYSFEALASSRFVDDVIIVAEESYRNMIEDAVTSEDNNDKLLGFADPGENRQLSIYNALRTIKDYMDKNAVVMIHDGVRPYLSPELIKRCDDAMNIRNPAQSNIDGVMPYLEVKDTIYLKDADGNISGMLDRGSLAAGQTPEFFDYWKYLKANEDLSEDEMMLIHGSTEPAVKAGMKITLVPGEESNFKITTPEDLERFKQMVEG